MNRNDAIAVCLALLSFVTTTTDAAELRTVALTGQQAPDAASGVIYESFGSIFQGDFLYHGPVLNDAGQVAFRADLAGDGVNGTNDQGIWSEGSGNLALVTRTGIQAPGAPAGVNFSTDPQLELYSPVLNNSGKTAFYASTTDGKLGLWSEGSGSLTPVARTGDPAPGTPSGVTFQFNSLYEYLSTPILNDAGKVSFRTYLSGTGVNNGNRFGLWSDASGSLELLARLGSQATGLPAGVNHGYMYDVGINDSGKYVFYSDLSGSGVNSTNERSLWSNLPGSLSMFARTGSQAPGLPDGVSISQLYNVLDINDAGQIAFVSGLSSENSQYGQDAIWLYDSGNTTLVARRGEHPPGVPDDVTWNLLGVPTVNNSGRMLFGSQLAGPGVDTSNELAVFFSDLLGNRSLIFREGDQAPGTPDGTIFDGVLESAVVSHGMNDAGQAVFYLGLAGDGVDLSNDKGLWATDANDVLTLIAREGDQLEVAPGDLRTIDELHPSGIPGNDFSWPSAFNNLGQLAFWAGFTDGSQGVFVSSAVAALSGDFNLSGAVENADLTLLLNNWAGPVTPTPTGWAGTPLTGPAVDNDELTALLNNWGSTLGGGNIGSGTIPEPGGLTLLGVMALALLSARLAPRYSGGRRRCHSPPRACS